MHGFKRPRFRPQIQDKYHKEIYKRQGLYVRVVCYTESSAFVPYQSYVVTGIT